MTRAEYILNFLEGKIPGKQSAEWIKGSGYKGYDRPSGKKGTRWSKEKVSKFFKETPRLGGRVVKKDEK